MIFEILIKIIIFIIIALFFLNKKNPPNNDIIDKVSQPLKKSDEVPKPKTNQTNYELSSNLGKVYQNITLEPFFDNSATGGSRIRVRPLHSFKSNTRVEFPRSLRETNEIGTKFSASVKVCQKTFTKTGLPKGQPYLLADNKTITLLKK